MLIDHIMKEKVLQINTDKSKFMIIGTKKITAQVKENLCRTSISLAGNTIKESDSEKYLGDYFHSQGNEKSIS